MAKNTAVFGIYANRGSAEEGVATLQSEGFRNTDISVLFPENAGSKDLAHEKATKAPEGATAGASSGAIIGGALGWLAGIGTLAIPGLGLFIAAGPIMGLLAGMGAGGAVGGVIGGLVGMGIPEYEAKRYEGRIRRGGILLSVHCDSSEWAKRAEKILRSTGAEDISSASEEKADFAKSDKPLTRVNEPARANTSVMNDAPLEQVRHLHVRDVMTAHAETIDAEASLVEASQRMRSLGVGFLPVRSGDEIVGVVTDRDITVRATAEGQDPAYVSVRQIASNDFARCYDHQTVMEAVSTMQHKQVRRLLVLDSDERLAGILSIEDVASRAGDDRLAGRILKRAAAS
jgi:CBS domain-containing protein